MDQRIIDAYEANVIRRSEDECWGWKGSRHPEGYGQFQIGTKIFRAHRIAYARSAGEISRGLDVRHLCHNPECSNPKHLASGTRKQNMHDSMIAGRLQRKIPRGDMPLIFEMRERGWTLQQIGNMYACTKQAVRHMIVAHPELAHA